MTPRPSSTAASSAQAQIRVEVNGTPSAATAHALAPLATSPTVLRGVRLDLGLSDPQAALAQRITASVDPASGNILISATGNQAAAIANSDAVGLIRIAKINAPSASLVIAQPASAPTTTTPITR